ARDRGERSYRSVPSPVRRRARRLPRRAPEPRDRVRAPVLRRLRHPRSVRDAGVDGAGRRAAPAGLTGAPKPGLYNDRRSGRMRASSRPIQGARPMSPRLRTILALFLLLAPAAALVRAATPKPKKEAEPAKEKTRLEAATFTGLKLRSIGPAMI